MKRALAITLLGAALLLAGCSATPPGKLETAIMAGAKRAILVGDKKQKNPLPATKDNFEAGKEAFSHYCVACHGVDGQNTGVPFAEKMSPPVPSLASSQVQAYTDGQLHHVIEHGVAPSGMPASQGILNDDEMWSIVLYIRRLPPAGSVGEPVLYSGECASPAIDTVSGSARASKRSGDTRDR